MTDDSSRELPVAGWYPYPASPGQLRYWTGEAWTEFVHEDTPSVDLRTTDVRDDSLAQRLEDELALPAVDAHVSRLPIIESAVQLSSGGSYTGGSPSGEIALEPLNESRSSGLAVGMAASPVTEPSATRDLAHSVFGGQSVLVHGTVTVEAARALAELPDPVTSPVAYGRPAADNVSSEVTLTPSDPDHLGDDDPAVGRRGRREAAPTRNRPIRGLALASLGLLVIVGLGFWLLRPHTDQAPTSPSVAASNSPSAPNPYQTGATYIAMTATTTEGLPTCATEAASWRLAGTNQLVATVVVDGPKLVVVKAIDKTHPERPNTTMKFRQTKAGENTSTFTIPLPAGGLGRVQVGIQGDSGIQSCDAPQAA